MVVILTARRFSIDFIFFFFIFFIAFPLLVDSLFVQRLPQCTTMSSCCCFQSVCLSPFLKVVSSWYFVGCAAITPVLMSTESAIPLSRPPTHIILGEHGTLCVWSFKRRCIGRRVVIALDCLTAQTGPVPSGAGWAPACYTSFSAVQLLALLLTPLPFTLHRQFNHSHPPTLVSSFPTSHRSPFHLNGSRNHRWEPREAGRNGWMLSVHRSNVCVCVCLCVCVCGEWQAGTQCSSHL